jgi:hypothetical protein
LLLVDFSAYCVDKYSVDHDYRCVYVDWGRVFVLENSDWKGNAHESSWTWHRSSHIPCIFLNWTNILLYIFLFSLRKKSWNSLSFRSKFRKSHICKWFLLSWNN